MQVKTYSYGRIWHIAYPILISALMEQIVGMTDTAFLGRVGEVELGACALGGIFYIAVFMLGLGFSTGAQIMMGRRNGEGAYERVGSILYQGIGFLMLVGAAIFLFIRYCGPWIINHIVSSPEVAAATNQYIYWRVCGVFFSFAAVMYRSFYVATTRTRVLTVNSLLMVGSNVLFNYILIFGNWGFPAYGIAGAAMASSLANVVSFVFYAVYTYTQVDCGKYGLKTMPRFDGGLLGRILSVSVWTMVQDFLSLFTWFLFFVSVEHLGQSELAVTNIVRNISSFTFMTVIALSSTASTLVSNLMGAGEHEAVAHVLRKTVKLGFFILCPVILVVALFPEATLGVFTSEPALIAAGVAPLYVLLSSYVLTIPAQIYFHAVSATGNTRTALSFELMSLTIYMVFVVVAIFLSRASLPVCWLSEHVYAFFCLLFSWTYMRSGRWKSKRI